MQLTLREKRLRVDFMRYKLSHVCTASRQQSVKHYEVQDNNHSIINFLFVFLETFEKLFLTLVFKSNHVIRPGNHSLKSISLCKVRDSNSASPEMETL